jgi:protocatechuate 3,4-dioxygenase beta subunit
MTVRFAMILPLFATALVQQAPARDVPAQIATGTAVVAGTVFTGVSGSDPARKTRVMLNSVDRPVPGLTVATDDAGRFEFRNVPAGRYRIEARKAGYLSASYGAARPNRIGIPVSVADGSRTDGLAIRLVHGAAISGTVRDARGRPMPTVTVAALRYNYSVIGERQLSSQSSVTTDDQGGYRLWGLPPGEYVVAVTPAVPGGYSLFPSNDFAMLTTADVDRALQGVPQPMAQPASPVPSGTYASVFSPGTADLSLATTLPIAAADDREGVDVVVNLVRTARIDGVVTRDGQPAGPARITLTRAGEAANLLGGNLSWRGQATTLDKQGRFTLADVTPGTYTLLALLTPPASQAPGVIPPSATWAMAAVSVDGADVAVSLAMQPAMAIAGRVVFDGSSPPPDNPIGLNVRLVPPGSGGNIGSGPPGGSVDADRAFRFASVTPGDYRVLTTQRSQWRGDWFLRSAIANGRDALDGALTIRPGDRTELVLTYTDRPTEMTGQFQDETGRPAPDYFIVLFPADRARWTPGSRRIVSTRPGNDGRYSMRGLPPGEYLLAALTDLDPQDLFSASFFEQLVPLALKVTLAEGQPTKQDLTVKK